MFLVHQADIVKAKEEAKLKKNDTVSGLIQKRNRSVEEIVGCRSYQYPMPAPAKNQKNKNSCFIAAPAAMVEALIEALTGKKVEFDVAALQKKVDKDDHGGFMHDGLNAMSLYGSQHKLFAKVDSFISPNTVTYVSKRIQLMDDSKKKLRNPSAFKYFLSAFGPVGIAVPMHECWKMVSPKHYRNVNGKFILMQPSDLSIDANAGNHYLVVFGFETAGNEIIFACKNSYGDTFGTNGVVYITIGETFPLMDVTPIVAIWSKKLGENICENETNIEYEPYEDFMSTFKNKMLQ